MRKFATFLFLLMVVAGSSVFAQTFSDNFESYTINQTLGPQSPYWTTWSNADGGSEDVNVVNTNAYSGTKSIYFNSPFGGGPNDVVLPFGGVNSSGRFKFSSRWFIPTGKGAYFNFQGGVVVGLNWSMEFYFNTSPTFSILGYLSGSYPQNRWFELVIDANLDTDIWEVFIDGVSQGTFSNTQPISFIDIYPASSNTECWIDDISYCTNNYCNNEISMQSVTVSPNPVCTYKTGDVTIQLKNNSTFPAPKMNLAVDVGADRITRVVNLNNLAGGKDTTITIPGMFMSRNAGSAISVKAINITGDPNPANDTAKSTVNVLLSPSGSVMSKGTPFVTTRPGTSGSAIDPDVVAHGDQGTYTISAPSGYTNSQYNSGSGWDIFNMSFKTNHNVAVSSSLFTTTNPSGSSDYKIAFNPDTTLVDSVVVITFGIRNKTNGCDSTVTRYIYVAAKPKADFSAPSVCDKDQMIFTNGSSLKAGIMSFRWDFGDGQSSTFQDPTHTYATHGTYAVKLVVTSPYDYKDSVTKNVDVFQIPIAGFNFNNACEGSPITMSDNSTLPPGTPTYDWDFGTSPVSTGSGASVSKLYSVPNIYRVTMKVTVNGCSSTTSRYVTQAPRTTPAFTSSATQCDNGAVTFTNGNAQPVFGMASYEWKFGDGNHSTEESPMHTYNAFNTYTVTLISRTDLGCKDSITHTVSLRQSPTASFNMSGATCSNSPIDFNNTSLVPSGSSNIYEWSFGDGDTSTTTSPSHQYTIPGQFTVTLKSTSTNGCSSETQLPVSLNLKPIADFGATTVCSGNSTEFTNSTYTPDNDPLTYVWKFGNGDSSTLPDAVISYTYPAAGTYSVSLTATHTNGCVDTKNISVKVNETPHVTILSNTANAGDGTVKFVTTTSGAGWTYDWQFDDGGSSTQQNPLYRYLGRGIMVVRLTVSTPDGCSGSASDTVRINSLGINNALASSVNVYPNPSSGRFTIDLGQAAADVKGINVTDMLGRTIVGSVPTTPAGLGEVDLSGQAAGIYYLNFSTVQGTHTVKITLNK